MIQRSEKKIKGFLVLLGVYMIFDIAGNINSIRSTISYMFRLGIIDTLLPKNILNFDLEILGYFFVHLLSGFYTIISMSYLYILYVQRSYKFRKHFLILFFLGFIINSLLCLYSFYSVNIEGFFTGYSFYLITYNISMLCIWSLYVYYSERLKNTFIEVSKIKFMVGLKKTNILISIFLGLTLAIAILQNIEAFLLVVFGSKKTYLYVLDNYYYSAFVGLSTRFIFSVFNVFFLSYLFTLLCTRNSNFIKKLVLYSCICLIIVLFYSALLYLGSEFTDWSIKKLKVNELLSEGMMVASICVSLWGIGVYCSKKLQKIISIK